MPGNEVLIVIDVDAKGVNKGLASAGKGLDKLKKQTVGADRSVVDMQRRFDSMGNTARQMPTKTKPMAKDMQAMDLQMGGVGASAAGAAGGMNFLLGKLGKLSVVGLSSAIILRGVTGATDQLRASVGLTNLIVGGLGGAAARTVEQMRPALRAIAMDFGFVQADAESAAGAIIRASQREVITLDNVRFALALARTAGMDLAAAGDIVGKALMGEVEPLAAITGLVRDFGDSQSRTIAEGLKATTQTQKWLAGLKTLGEFAGEAADSVFRLIDTLTSNSIVQLIIPNLDKIAAALGFIVKAVKEPMKFVLGFEITGVPVWWAKFIKDAKTLWNLLITATWEGLTLPKWTAPFFEAFVNGLTTLAWVVTVTPLWRAFKLPGWTKKFLKNAIQYWGVMVTPLWTPLVLPKWTAPFFEAWVKGLTALAWAVSVTPLWIAFKLPGWTKKFLKNAIQYWGVMVTPIWTPLTLPDWVKGFIKKAKQSWTAVLSIEFHMPGPLQALIDLLKRAPGNILEGLNLTGSQVGAPGVKGYAHGGIVNRPTLAMVGEAGPEAIVPLRGGGGGLGVNLTINIENLTVDDELRVRQTAREISDLIDENLRRGA